MDRRPWNRTRPCSVSASRAATDTDLRWFLKLRRQGSNLLLAINSRASYPFDFAGTKAEGEGVEPPTAEAAPVFETGYRANGSPSPRNQNRMAPAGVEPALCRL